MNESNTNLLLKAQKVFNEVIAEAKLLTLPSLQQTLQRTFVILILCGILSLYFILIGEIIVKLISLFGV